MTQVNCFLDDPVGCDLNVPYMNPQCLFSLHKRLPMTFDLPQMQQPYIDSFSRASLDILSGFETADDFESSASPTVLLTELKDHVQQGKLAWCMHHGKRRFKLKDHEKPPVFTTYQTLEGENRRSVRSSDSIFSHHWRRIILDEAHTIRNHKTSTAQAMAALRATSRWAVSGTPIQNSLLDFHGLFKFLHFAPYDDPKAFDDDISSIWRTKSVEDAGEIFKTLLSCIMIRRTKAILDLPCKDDQLIRVPFSHEEERHYRQIEQPVLDMLDRTTGNGSQTQAPWMTAIQQINKLRLVCNLGVFTPSQVNGFSQPGSLDDTTSVMSARFSMGGGFCELCFQPVEKSILSTGLRDPTQEQVYYSACSKFYCADLSPSSMDWDYANEISSKVWALVSQIRLRPQEKHVVFSSWTSSLDMVERALRSNADQVIQFVRIDGKVQPKKRSLAIERLRDDPGIRVILITIACGACGLDLTAASAIHLLEPQWNPSLEDQALARVHRLGQTRPVTTIRYIMKDSFEEHILKVQDRKKLLATTLLSNGSSLENLRQLLHERKGGQHA
ncbi:hypothetical protein J4E85_003748 [Alternaria conjuncta]|uniref:uncharacterized protein n=1 Tax=Alternaria conjuncta TaxID=181017 RepID=UPI002220EB1C|nr:uncharacterized protein J4E85_003748 [Alternaria conjuncta]KAI4931159.1 hypothetical protein J4E85_003748 [Alternaria conjuncta]